MEYTDIRKNLIKIMPEPSSIHGTSYIKVRKDKTIWLSVRFREELGDLRYFAFWLSEDEKEIVFIPSVKTNAYASYVDEMGRITQMSKLDTNVFDSIALPATYVINRNKYGVYSGKLIK